MRLIAFCRNGDGDKAELGIVIGANVVPISVLNELTQKDFATDMFTLLESNQWDSLKHAVAEVEERAGTRIDFGTGVVPFSAFKRASTGAVQLAPLYRRPRKIWGIGLNYVEHAGDLNAVSPTDEPASFMKADTTLIGPGDSITLPWQSERVTAEGEIAIVIGKPCRNVTEAEAPDYVAGFVAVTDMTAEDILQKNPRFLTRAKNFDTFFSLGGELVTVDEIDSLPDVTVGTYKNGQLHRENVVGNMTFDPWYLVAFHSQVMQLLPGDIISTGTPGAVVIQGGDVVECRIDGFLPLQNPVRGVNE